MSDQAILDEVIIGYRKAIEDRYQYEYLNAKYELPESFGAEK